MHCIPWSTCIFLQNCGADRLAPPLGPCHFVPILLHCAGMPPGPFIVAVSVGNTRIQVGRFNGDLLEKSERFANTDLAPVVQAVASWWKDIPNASGSVLLASVNDPIAAKLTSALEDQLSVDVYRVGEDVPIPVGQELDPE